jgi:hypothetical protein
MSFKGDFVGEIGEHLCARIEGLDGRPNMEVWPEEDDFGRWVASHEARVQSVLCATPEFRAAPFCGRGFH